MHIYQILIILFLAFPLAIRSDSSLSIPFVVSCQSSPLVEIEAGETLTASFLIINHSKSSFSLIGQMNLPQSWSVLPNQVSTFVLEEKNVQLFAIKIPSHALPGKYFLCYRIACQDEPSLFYESHLRVMVLPHIKVHSTLEQPPKQILAGDSYSSTLHLVNTGNASIPLTIKTNNAWNYPVEAIPPYLYLEPGEAQSVKIIVKTEKYIPEKFSHITNLEVYSDQQNCLCSHTTIVDIYPSVYDDFDPYHYLPVQTTLGFGTEDHKKQAFIETVGGGPLNEEGTKNLSFLFRVPIIKQTNLVNELYGIPESNFIHYWTPQLDAYAGDGIYCLTPLTLCQYGTGALLSVYPSCISSGAIYLNRIGHQSSSAGGGFIAFTRKKFNLMAALINTNLNKHDRRIRRLSKESQTFSLSTNIKMNSGEIDLEWAKSEGGKHGKGQAFYFYGEGQWGKEINYCIKKIYADPHFVGYYSDMDQFGMSVGFPIKGKLRGTIAYNTYEANLKRSFCKYSAPRDKSGWIGVSYTFPSQLYTMLTYNQCEVQNVLQEHSYRIRYLSLILGKPYLCWNYQGLFEIGQYQHYHQTKKTHHHLWQNYQFYLNFTPSCHFQYSLYSRLGYLMFFNDDIRNSYDDLYYKDSVKIDWSWIYGICVNWNSDYFNFRCLFEKTKYSSKSKRHFIAWELNRILHNSHALSVKGSWDREFHCKQDFKILFTYTIPWLMPIGSNRKEGCANGKILGPSEVVPSIEIRCNNGKQLISNSQGKFVFSHLKPGLYHLWIEDKENQLVPKEALPIYFEVQKAKKTEIKVEMVEAAQLSGLIKIFEADPNIQARIMLHSLNDPKSIDNTSIYKEKGGWKNAIIKLHSEEDKGDIYAITDSQGMFFFNKISPGKWILLIQTDNLPSGYYLERNEISLDILPGDVKRLEFKALPIERQLKIIDQSNIQLKTNGTEQ